MSVDAMAFRRPENQEAQLQPPREKPIWSSHLHFRDVLFLPLTSCCKFLTTGTREQLALRGRLPPSVVWTKFKGSNHQASPFVSEISSNIFSSLFTVPPIIISFCPRRLAVLDPQTWFPINVPLMHRTLSGASVPALALRTPL